MLVRASGGGGIDDCKDRILDLIFQIWNSSFWFEIGRCMYQWESENRIMIFTTLLFHSLFKVEFGIDHFVLGEHRER